jgi:prepilin-type N-terminal cleavage/methylation domain-containing protein/prepilin-type processing-associated H-X9-DG protein
VKNSSAIRIFRPGSRSIQRGFTLIELLIVIAIIAVLAGLLLPALHQAKIRANATGCLSNLKQLQIAWQIYANDFNDVLLPNAPSKNAGVQMPANISNSMTWCGTAMEGWGSLDANTNTSYYTQSALASYLSGQIRVYKCPGDTMLSANGARLRSYSMNSQVGQYLLAQLGPNYVVNLNPGYKVYNTMNDLDCPGPSMAWIFADEHPGSIDDGFLRVNLTAGDWPDVPGSLHGGSGSFSFADGHVELRKWLTGILNIPVIQNVPVHDIQGGVNNADYLWFTRRTACLIGQ